MDALLDSLNSAQRAAVTSEANVLQVLAPPGSGKTKTLTARVSYLISKCGYQPWNMLICTFTVKAAKEMRQRIIALVGESLAKKLILGTFHSVARRFLVSYGHYIGLDKSFGIADTSDSKAIIKRIVKQHHLSIEPSRAQARISSQKAKGITSEHYAVSARKGVDEQEFTTVYAEYETALRRSNLLDYDDLLLRCALLLRTNPQCVANIQAVLIDEFQDTNEVQFDLMTLFAQYRRTITIVGDPDQSIYGWRNAEIKNLETMKVHYPDTVVHFLEENYRSSGAILGAAQAVIEQDESRPAKRLQATHVHGEQPVLRRLPTAENEARWLAGEIKRTQALTGNILQTGDYAILLRSASVSRHIETALGNAGIPYRMVGGTKFYDRAEVKTILDYLRIVNQPEHNDALLRILNVPARNIGEVTVKNLLDQAQRNKTPLWDVLLASAKGRARSASNLSAQAQKGVCEFVGIITGSQKKFFTSEDKPLAPADLVDYLIRKTQFENYLKKKYPDDFDARWANVGELRAQMVDLTVAMAANDDLFEEENLPVVEGVEQRTVVRGVDALSVFLGNIALTNDVQKKTDEQVEESKCVTVSTIHAAKGLEWPVVFIPACYTGCIPHSRAEDHDEERRLLYVGMTRAQAILYLSCPSKNSQTQDTTISSFLTEGLVTSHFVPQGPVLEYYAVSQLAGTLHRTLPEFATVEITRRNVDRLADDKWPLDGTELLEDVDKWQYSRAKAHFGRESLLAPNTGPPPGCAGFVSAASIAVQEVEGYSIRATTIPSKMRSRGSRVEQLEQVHEENVLRKVDARTQKTDASKNGRKICRAASGSANISSYFGKTSAARPAKPAALAALQDEAEVAGIAAHSVKTPQASNLPTTEPLAEITSLVANHQGPPRGYNCFSAVATHKVRTKPIRSRSPEAELNGMPVAPSSPLKENDSKKQKVDEVDGTKAAPYVDSKPATSFHATTMSQVGNMNVTRARTLGLSRGFVPWSARGGKR